MPSEVNERLRPTRTAPRDAGAAPYLEALERHVALDPRRLNVPAHKGGPYADAELLRALGPLAFTMDIPPQVDDIDMGSYPTPLDQAELLAADAWRAARTWFMLGGASDANRAACLALAGRGRTVLVQRNVHVSTIAGLVLAGLTPVFVAPEVDAELGIAHCVTPTALRAALAGAGEDVAGIILVSPTYFGAAADVAGLVAAGHEHDLPVVVDEAWGAHFAFHPGLPTAALDAGADLVISSTHKMLGSLTQSAMLHLGRDSRLDASTIDRSVTLLRTTSPSALLMASLDGARRQAVSGGEAAIERSLPAIGALHDRLREIPGVEVLGGHLAGEHGVASWDPFRLAVVLPAAGPAGHEVVARLRTDASTFIELTSPRVLVAIVGLGEQDTGPLVEQLAAAIAEAPDRAPATAVGATAWGEPALDPRSAFLGPSEVIDTDAAIGRISSDTLAIYPPGIPNVVPGERFTAEVVAQLRDAAAEGLAIRGASDPGLTTVRVSAIDAGGL